MAILHKDKYDEKEKLYALFLAIAEHKYRFFGSSHDYIIKDK